MAGYIIPESGDYKVQRNMVSITIDLSDPDGQMCPYFDSLDSLDVGLMPAEPPYVSKQQERLSTTTVPGLHGSLIQPSFKDRTNTRRNWETCTGSLDFYYVPDGKNHVLWDEYMMSVSERSVDGVTHAHPWCFFGQYHTMMHLLQGRRAEKLRIPGNTGGFDIWVIGECEVEDPIRVWVSKVKPDSSGRTTVTLSYEIQPDLAYSDF